MIKEFIKLPLLRQMLGTVQQYSNLKLENVVFVCIQHLLETNVDLFNTLIQLGAKPENIFLMGKSYSHSLTAIQHFSKIGIKVRVNKSQFELGGFSDVFNEEILKFWETITLYLQKSSKIDTICILDDGGYCLTSIPTDIMERYKTIGLEQTTAGLFKLGIAQVPIPIIQVASSAAKRVLESPIIANAISNKVGQYIPLQRKNLKCGVVGCGAIGQAVVNKLRSLGCMVSVYDTTLKHNPSLIPIGLLSNSLDQIIKNSDIIIGCTGRDIFKNMHPERLLNGNKIFISCSSEDKEFLTLLRWIRQNLKDKQNIDPLKDITYTSDNFKITILRGGYPINFDNCKEVEPASDIQLTRGLMLGGILQALIYLNSANVKNYARYMLNPDIQRYIALNWRKMHPVPQNNPQINRFYDTKWIARQSGGENLKSQYVSELFIFRSDEAQKSTKLELAYEF